MLYNIFSLILLVAIALPASAQKAKKAVSSAPQLGTVLTRRAKPAVKGGTFRQMMTKAQARAQQARSPFKQAPRRLRLPMTKRQGIIKAPFRADLAPVTLNAALVYTEDDNGAVGAVSLQTNSNIITLENDMDEIAATNSGCISDKLLWTSVGVGFSYFGPEYYLLYCIDPIDYTVVSQSEVPEEGSMINGMSAMASDPTDNTVYGFGLNAEGEYVFAKLNKSAMAFEDIATTPDDLNEINSMSFNAQGQLYGIDGDGTLYSIDKATGALDSIQNFPEAATQYLTSGVIDPKTNIYYYCPNTDDASYMIAIDLDAKTCQQVVSFDYGEEFSAMWMPVSQAEATAPGAAQNFALNFDGGALTGKVSFDAPATYYDETPATGTVDYKVFINDSLALTGTANYGDTGIERDITVSKPAVYTVSVLFTNTTGDGPKVKSSQWIGFDQIKPVSDVALTLNDATSTLVLTWKPAVAVHGGYVNAADIRYDVYKDSIKIASDLADTIYTMPYTEGDYEVLQYSIVAKYEGFSTEATQSNGLGVGKIVPPYYNAFTSNDCLDGYTLLSPIGKYWTTAGDYGILASYSNEADMDSWAITPGITLKAGKTYDVSIETAAYSKSFPERIEVKAGASNTVEAMTAQVIDRTDVTNGANDGYVTLKGKYTATADGKVYFGIHGCSDIDEFYLYARNLAIEEAPELTAPDSVTNLTVTPDATGATKAVVSFKAPAVDLAGTALTSLDSITVSRDGNQIATILAPAPGSEQAVTDEGMTDGVHNYTVIAFNASGSGTVAKAGAFIGLNTPGAPDNATITETATPGEVTVAWDAPSLDIDGNPLVQAGLTYAVKEYTGGELKTIKDGITGNSFTFKACEADEQDFVYYYVFATNRIGESTKYAVTDMIPVGASDDTPYTESFADGTLTHQFALVDLQGNMKAGLFKDQADLASQDGDNGFFGFQGQALYDSGTLASHKITVKAGDVLTFWRYAMALDDKNLLTAGVIADGQEHQLVSEDCTGYEEANTWHKYTFDLSAYAGKDIQIYFSGTILKYTTILLDNISIGTPVDNDLSLASFYAPAKVMSGTDFDVNVSVRNDGALTTSDYTVQLYRDGKLVATQAGTEIAANARANYKFTENLSAAADTATYQAKVVFAADQRMNNNDSKLIKTAVKKPNYPEPTGLTAKVEGTNAKLEWSEPNLDVTTPETVTDEVESYESWSIDEAGEWGFIDADGADTYGFSGLSFPGMGDAMSYIVIDAAAEGFENAKDLEGHSGNKSFGTFAASPAPNDDWLISPLLSGEAQTISFWAKTYADDYGFESFELWTSTTGNAKDDFTLFDPQDDNSPAVPADWTEFKYELPAGTKYFAIRCTSNDQFIFMVDDITYTPGNIAAELSLVGYNVYLNGEKLNQQTVAETEYTAALGESGEYNYVVTAVYTAGESKPSNVATISYSTGISQLGFKAAKVSTAKNTILIQNAEGHKVSLATADGRVIYNGNGTQAMTVRVMNGVYIVNIDGKVKKVMVK